jgi:hypothetical protein
LSLTPSYHQGRGWEKKSLSVVLSSRLASIEIQKHVSVQSVAQGLSANPRVFRSSAKQKAYHVGAQARIFFR